MTRNKLERIITHAISGSPKGSAINAIAVRVADAIDVALIMESEESAASAEALPANPRSISFVESAPPQPIAPALDAPSLAVLQVNGTPPAPRIDSVIITAANSVWDSREMAHALETHTPLTFVAKVHLLDGTTRDLELTRNIVIPHGTDTVRLEYAPGGGGANFEAGAVRRVFDLEEPSINITSALDGLQADASKLWSQVNVTPRPPVIMSTPRIIG